LTQFYFVNANDGWGATGAVTLVTADYVGGSADHTGLNAFNQQEQGDLLFTPHDTTATAAALMFYSPGLVGYSAVKIASPSFYSMGDSRTPATVSVASIGVNLVLNIMLVQIGLPRARARHGHRRTFNAGAVVSPGRRLDGLDRRRIARDVRKDPRRIHPHGRGSHFAALGLNSALPSQEWARRACGCRERWRVGVVVLAWITRPRHRRPTTR
jgi:hypothetical protein